VKLRAVKLRAALMGSTAAGFAAVLALHGGATPSVAVGPTRSPTPTTTPSQVPSGTRSATGPIEQYGYGQLAVTVTVKGHAITDVHVVGLQTAEQYSQSLAQQVVPMLRNEVLTAQSAQVNGISGATYTAQAYLTSLQAALDTLHV